MNVKRDAASLCFVTNSKAKEQNLKGKKVDLPVIKIGAQDENIDTMKYILQDHRTLNTFCYSRIDLVFVSEEHTRR